MNYTFKALVVVLVLLAVLLGSSCRRTDYRVYKIRVPELKNERCVEVIRDAFVRYAQQQSMESAIRVDRISFNLDGRWVVVEYDSMKVALKNLEHTIADAGFAANDIPANAGAAAKLPPECR